MNQKKMKRIRFHARVVLVAWLSTLLDDNQKENVNPDTILTLLSDQTHYVRDNQMFLSHFSYKWVVKQLKKLASMYPQRPIESFTLREVSTIGGGTYAPN